MAAPIVNFTSEYSITNANQLILTDTSVYNDTPIINRQWVVTKTNGSVVTIDAPLNGSDSAVVTVDRDYALVIKLRLNYNNGIADSGFSKTRNILAANNLAGAIYDLRKNFVVAYNKKTKSDKELNDLIINIELTDSFYEAAINLISTDVVAAQEALDLGNNQATLCNCN